MNPAILFKRSPRVLLQALKYRAFLFKERHLRFRKFSPNGKQGINLAGYTRAEMGLGEAARGFASALTAAQVPFNVINFEEGNKARHGDLTWAHKEVQQSDFDVTLIVINPDNIFNARAHLPEGLFKSRYVIASWFWELPNLPDEWKHAFSLVNEVWVASEFLKANVQKISPVPVIKMPLVVHVGEATLSRKHFDLPENCFLFLTMCDTGSVFERKNPIAAIEAFQRSFGPDRKDVGLVVKISGPAHRSPNWELIQRHVAGYPNIFLINRVLNPDERNSLLNVCDCYVSLHRAEGFGLVPAEMMSLGKPVIVTRWSGNVDYMTDQNSVGIDYKIVELAEDHGPYQAGQQWAEPDVDQAAHWMNRLCEDGELTREIGLRGQETINSNFTPELLGKKISERLQEVRKLHS